MRRRTLLETVASGCLAGLAGCGGFRLQPANRAPPLVDDRPDAVYFPTHTEGMAMIDSVTSGGFGIGLMYSFPHRFWTTTGTRTEAVSIRSADSIHLMATVWDADSGMVLPIGAGLVLEVSREGDTVLERAPWPMISPTMGFHFGDNIALPTEGEYTVTVRVGPVSERRLGGFADRFTQGTEVSVPFEFSRRRRDDLAVRTFGDKAGSRAVPGLMEMEMLPTSRLPPGDQLPGRPVGQGTSGDARFVVRRLDTDSGPYLAVSPRTPFNRVPLPMMSLTIRHERGGTRISELPLKSAIGPDLQFHYGATVDEVASGDRLTIIVEAPPQVSRHEGYETAFLTMSPVSVTVP